MASDQRGTRDYQRRRSLRSFLWAQQAPASPSRERRSCFPHEQSVEEEPSSDLPRVSGLRTFFNTTAMSFLKTRVKPFNFKAEMDFLLPVILSQRQHHHSSSSSCRHRRVIVCAWCCCTSSRTAGRHFRLYKRPHTHISDCRSSKRIPVKESIIFKWNASYRMGLQ